MIPATKTLYLLHGLLISTLKFDLGLLISSATQIITLDGMQTDSMRTVLGCNNWKPANFKIDEIIKQYIQTHESPSSKVVSALVCQPGGLKFET
jgi:hypothetical protein